MSTRCAFAAAMFVFAMVLSRNAGASESTDSEQPLVTESPARILFLNSYHQGYEWSDSIVAATLQTFRQQAPESKIYIEYLDTKHFEWTEARKQAAERNLTEKYGVGFFDLAVVSDDPAFGLIKEIRDRLIPGKPVVFCGVNFIDPDDPGLPEGFTGVMETFDYRGIQEMVSAVFPARRHAVQIVDNSVTGQSAISNLKRYWPTDSGFTFDFLDGHELSHAELLGRLRSLGPDTFVIIGVWQTDRTNAYFTVTQAFEDIVSASSAPVFVVLRTDPRIGFVGGSAVSGAFQGRKAASMALDILAGRPVSDIPVNFEVVSDRMLNRKILEERWGVRWDALPESIRKIPNVFLQERGDQKPAEMYLSPVEKQFIRDNPVVKVMLRDAPPLLIATDPPSGFAVDLMNEISDLTGLEIRYEFWYAPVEEYLARIRNGDNTHVIPAFTDTPERRKYFTFSRTYSEIQWVIFTRDDSRFVSGLDDLKGRKVAVDGRFTIFNLLAEKYPGMVTVPFESSREALTALDSGRVDAYVGHLSTGAWIIRDLGLGRIRVAAPTGLAPQPVSVAVPRDMTVLASIIDKAVGAIPPERIESLKNRYADRLVLHQGWETEKVLKLLLFAASLFMLILAVLLWRLRARSTALRQREQNLQVTLDSIGDAVIVTDPGLHITRMNPVAERLTGWTMNDAAGLRLDHILTLVEPDSDLPVADSVKAIGMDKTAGASSRIPRMVSLISKNGSRYLIEHSLSPITAHTGESFGVVMVFRDVTDRHRFEEQIQHSRKMEAIGQLAGGVAHDFNNMLSAIQGYAELLTRRVPENSVESTYCQRIFNATERAAGLTSKLLDFARKGKTLSTPIDIHDSIRNALALLERSIDKSIVINAELRARNSFIVGDPSQIQSAILNLCINARDAMPTGGTLDVLTDNVILTQAECGSIEFDVSPGEYVCIKVRDTGTGIPRENLKRIFEPFFTTKGVGKGTGLGLAAVHGALVEHSGAVTVYSEEGKGTQFNIFLPVSHERAMTMTGEYRSNIRREGLVLVVEDEPLIRSMAEVMLKDVGFDVITADNGKEGLEKYKRSADRIRLVLLDVIMPEMDGMTALKAMKKHNSAPAFIITSGFSFDHRRDEFIAAGAKAFLSKPFRNSELLRAIEESLGSD